MKKKAIHKTIPDVRDGPARDLDAGAERGARGYPSARDLLSRAPEWKTWLEGALRALTAPAAIAGAMTLAASGCDTDLGDDLGVSLRPIGPAIATGPRGPAAVPGGKIPNTSFASGPGVVLTPLPPTGVVTPTGIVTPPTHPIATAGAPPAVMPPPASHPPALRGDVATVLPVLPPVPPPTIPTTLPELDPTIVDGGARPVMPEPATAMPGRISPVRAR